MKLILIGPIFFLFSCNKETLSETSFEQKNTIDSIVVYKPYEVEITYKKNNSIYQQKTFDKNRNLTKFFQFDSLSASISYTYYHPNGYPAETGRQGEFNGCGVELGPVLRYNEYGYIYSEERFKYSLAENEVGCHSMEIERTVTEFENGNLLSVKTYCSSYESEEILCFK